jgi:hypothetical protein
MNLMTRASGSSRAQTSAAGPRNLVAEVNRFLASLGMTGEKAPSLVSRSLFFLSRLS